MTTTTTMRTIKLQPKMKADGTLPYPYFIDPDNGEIGRQDIWRGKPLRLLGFSETAETGQMQLELLDFFDDPLQAVGMYMVTEHEDGGWYTASDPIDEVIEMNV